MRSSLASTVEYVGVLTRYLWHEVIMLLSLVSYEVNASNAKQFN
jgi:hypothetical protein